MEVKIAEYRRRREEWRKYKRQMPRQTDRRNRKINKFNFAGCGLTF